MKKNPTMSQREYLMSPSELQESAIKGLMLLGQTRAEAFEEFHRNQDRRIAQMEADWYNGKIWA